MRAAFVDPPAAASTSKPRLRSLDVLRGVAVLGVLFAHYVVAPDEAGALRALAEALTGGGVGVTLFFVLSGYLIGGLLFAEIQRRGALDVVRFLTRRGFKIWPSYYVYLVGVFGWLIVVQGDGVAAAVWRLVPNLLHVQNYLGTPVGHTWTLGVEEHFYLSLPVGLAALLWLGKANGRADWVDGIPRFLPACVVLLFATATLRFLLFLDLERAAAVGHHTHVRMDALLFGVLLAYVSTFRPAWVTAWVRRPSLWFGVGMLPGLLHGTPLPESLPKWASAWWYVAVYVGFGVAVLAAVQARPETSRLAVWFDGWMGRGLAWIGLYSYTIYLCHVPFAARPFRRAIATFVPGSVPGEVRWVVGMSVYFAGAVLMGWIMSRLVEYPMLKLRDRLYPRRAELQLSPAGGA